MRVVVGIDSAKDRVDLVVLEDGVYADHLSIDVPKHLVPDRGGALRYMRRRVDDLLRSLPDTPEVFIEESIVRGSLRTATHLAQTVGMLLALPHRCETVIIQHWKMTACGNGQCSKEGVRKAITLRMPKAAALYGKRQDLFDATGVAIHGDALLRRR